MIPAGHPCKRVAERTANRPRILDLYCGAGGAARGYQLAGFHLTGIDSTPQPRYAGHVFIQGDALEYLEAHGREYDAIHASPPCQAHTTLRALVTTDRDYPDLIGPTRELLHMTGLPYIIENVPGAPLQNYVTLCGSSFNLKVRRHRLFESNLLLLAPACQHKQQGRPLGVYGNGGDWSHKQRQAGERSIRAATVGQARRAMGMPWGTRHEVSQAIPPAYTQHLGSQLLIHLTTPQSGTQGATT